MKEITLDATASNIAVVTDFVNAELEVLGCPSKARMQLDVAIDEVFGNISRYAYGSAVGCATVRLGFDEVEREVTLTFVDSGSEFNPCEAPEPDITLMLEERPIGGLGLFMVKKMMDGMAYRREDGRNILTLRKRI